MALLWDIYFDWLLKEVNFMGGFDGGKVPTGSRQLPSDYYILMRKLHETDFKWVIDRDENRAKDGLALRSVFFNDIEITSAAFIRDCSILEMLVGLAIRVEEEYIGDPMEPHPEIFFWDMIHNLGLDTMDDGHFDEVKCDKIINIWMKREFDSDGLGSPWPLKFVTFDSREAEIWRQVMAYLSENY